MGRASALHPSHVCNRPRESALAPQHPEWQSNEPFKAVLSNDRSALGHFSERDWAEIIFVTHAGMSQAEFVAIAGQWLATAKHPRFKRLYTELVYQPMIEVLNYLRTNRFETFIVTGGGQDFVRAYGQRVYSIPTQKVIGSSIATKYEYKDGKPELMRLPKLFFNDNFDDKAVGIDLFIGKCPYAAFSNSTGDQEMLEWTGAGEGARLKMLVYHDDADARVCLRPRGRPAGHEGRHVLGLADGRGKSARLDSDQHEERLEPCVRRDRPAVW